MKKLQRPAFDILTHIKGLNDENHILISPYDTYLNRLLKDFSNQSSMSEQELADYFYDYDTFYLKLINDHAEHLASVKNAAYTTLHLAQPLFVDKSLKITPYSVGEVIEKPISEWIKVLNNLKSTALYGNAELMSHYDFWMILFIITKQLEAKG